jgi:hypothetical protein
MLEFKSYTRPSTGAGDVAIPREGFSKRIYTEKKKTRHSSLPPPRPHPMCAPIKSIL